MKKMVFLGSEAQVFPSTFIVPTSFDLSTNLQAVIFLLGSGWNSFYRTCLSDLACSLSMGYRLVQELLLGMSWDVSGAQRYRLIAFQRAGLTFASYQIQKHQISGFSSGQEDIVRRSTAIQHLIPTRLQFQQLLPGTSNCLYIELVLSVDL